MKTFFKIRSLFGVLFLFTHCFCWLETATSAPSLSGILRTVPVSTASDLQKALQNAQAGDEILLAEGIILIGQFKISAQGTEQYPILIRSVSASKVATLSSTTGGNVLTVSSDYCIVKDIQFIGGQKGVVFDHAHHSEIMQCDISQTEDEGLHFRDASQYCVADGCNIHDTGNQTPGYGEGIYIGSDVSSWDKYAPAVFYTTIKNCTVGPNVRAECIDIKEGTKGTVIDSCNFYGVGMGDFSTTPPTIANFADSFIDIKCPDIIGDHKGIDDNGGVSNDVKISNCTFDRLYNPVTQQMGDANSTVCAQGVQLHYKNLTDAERALLNPADYNQSVAEITNNTFNMGDVTVAHQDGDAYVIKAWSSSGYYTVAAAENNLRNPVGALYYGDVIVLSSLISFRASLTQVSKKY